MQGQIRVSTEKLRKKKEEWKETLRRMEENIRKMQELQDGMEVYFDGYPADTLMVQIKELCEEGLTFLERFFNHIEKLEEIAAIYEIAERSNVNAALDH